MKSQPCQIQDSVVDIWVIGSLQDHKSIFAVSWTRQLGK